MKVYIILIFQTALLICSNSLASVYDFSIRSFADKKVFVVKSNDLSGNYLRGKDSSNYSPTAINDYIRLNNKEIKRLVYHNERYIWILAGKKLIADGLEGEKIKCVVASIPLTVGLDGETNLDITSAVTFKADYAFCDPIGDRDWHMSGKDSGLALLPQELWFKDVKIDVTEYMKKVQIYDAAEENERSKLLMDDLKQWGDVRGLAVLERIFELPNINIQEIASIINSKGSEFQLYSMSIVISSKLPQKIKMQFADSKNSNSIKNAEQLLNQLAKWPIDPKDEFMTQIRLMIKQ